ncbi:phosphotransferase family protein [Paenibacillus nasutitermitis]|uniref:Aminoglycoside phosphotransferase domain-containing protein n=1 Tax=Paenibacillus nasutitermitis TaxID=1652958 RepID=A0A916YS58_9BACL|nr:aminoglycoside phosphotransferase family protein [Paenibacillus nasutitermitis]GGD58956.1 hypothetical protein GCM10010911_15990 [Paenibacillus nasutitermitis]
MAPPLGIVDWVEINENLDALFSGGDRLTVHPMKQGYEAEVMKICSDQESYVLKVWNKNSRPDVGFQFRLLSVLHERGVSVPKPLGWGINTNGDKVLLTTFDGVPIHKTDKKKMTLIANLLTTLHRTRGDDLESIPLPRYSFTDYFFPGVREHPDLWNPFVSVVKRVQIKQEQLIHGDFHINNIVEENGRLTIIDWTNGQLGDSRFDFAWSLTLQKIYLTDLSADVFRSAYVSDNKFAQQELDVFEALAWIRWMLLHRSGGAPGGHKTIEKVRRIQTTNPLLRDYEVKKAK